MSPNNFNKKLTSRWHLLYYVLAGIDVLLVISSFILTSYIISDYSKTVDESSFWHKQMSNYRELADLAAAMNRPGNEVFSTKDINKAKLDLLNAKDRFNVKLSDFISSIGTLPVETKYSIYEQINEIYEPEKSMLASANSVFASLANGEEDQAGKHMSNMDNEFYALNTSLSDLNGVLANIQQQKLNSQKEDLKKLSGLKTFTAGFIFLMILLIVFYGRSLSQKIRRDEIESSALLNELESYKDYLNIIFDSNPDSVIVVDKNGIIKSCNLSIANMFGYDVRELEGQAAAVLFQTDGDEEQDKHVLLQPGSREMVARRKNGKTFFADISIAQFSFKNDEMLIGTIKDIDNRKNLETLREQFLSTISHELRTPLTAILGSISLLDNEEMSTVLNDTEKKSLTASVHTNSKKLHLLINDLLDVQKMEAGLFQYDFDRFNIKELIQNTAEELEGLTTNTNKSIITTGSEDTDLFVDGDKHRIGQVLSNFLSNALKFSPDEGKVTISIECDDDALQVSVSDEGEGIPSEFNSRIFTKFSQANSSANKKHYGTGLGLAISKSIIDAHEGEIGFYNNNSGGATFYFKLPVMRSAA